MCVRLLQNGAGGQAIIAVLTMACLGSARLCARLGHISARRKTPAAVVDPLVRAAFFKTQACSSSSSSSASATAAPLVAPSASSIAQSYTAKRALGTMHTQHPGSLPREDHAPVDPYRLLEDDLKEIYAGMRQELTINTNQKLLQTISTYYFDGQGKAFRPMLAILMARAVNCHLDVHNGKLLPSQRSVAMIAEMIHTASLVHDDVIDQADMRRGKPSAPALWDHKKVTIAGDFILSVASQMIARLRNPDVTQVLSMVLTDLVQGEFMQLGSKETENERFAHYLTKTYRKTASLTANSLKAVVMLGGADESIADVAFQYGRNVGLAFQLVDDLIDFISNTETLGKPAMNDLKAGLATAPVLFACEKYPELNPMIMRRFEEPGDPERAFELVHKSNGLEQTRFLARKYNMEATRLANSLAESPFQKALVTAADMIINRMK
ncbi:Hypothetical predicted protein [Cloeon dipterum]|uniref:All trans-polyprenyl-diphosphate synthase PDSS1 n=4 Tax=Cloeon dipterum TaxID=197152 RepID=A0A8S1CGB6_9INSE|nr:Hypothetical predicted protein [Cloeon dipterum]